MLAVASVQAHRTAIAQLVDHVPWDLRNLSAGGGRFGPKRLPGLPGGLVRPEPGRGVGIELRAVFARDGGAGGSGFLQRRGRNGLRWCPIIAPELTTLSHVSKGVGATIGIAGMQEESKDERRSMMKSQQ